MSKTFRDLLREARAEIREVDTSQAAEAAARGAVLVDVRETSEWEQGHIPGAHHVPRSYVEQDIESVAPDRATPLVLYCAGGIRSLFAAQTLQAMGYQDIASMRGGFQAWKSEGRAEPAGAPQRRAEGPLLAPPAHPRGRRGRPGPAAGLPRPLGVGLRSGPAGDALPRRRRRGHHRHRRLRRGRPFQPAAPGRPSQRSRGHEEDGIGPR